MDDSVTILVRVAILTQSVPGIVVKLIWKMLENPLEFFSLFMCMNPVSLLGGGFGKTQLGFTQDVTFHAILSKRNWGGEIAQLVL